MNTADAIIIFRSVTPADCTLGEVWRDYCAEDDVTSWSADVYEDGDDEPIGFVCITKHEGMPRLTWL